MNIRNIFSAILLTSFYAAAYCATTVVQLKTNMRINPLGIDNAIPQFNWQVKSEERGIYQKAYEIIVCDNPQNFVNGLNAIWNSGRIESNVSYGVSFAGNKLKSNTRYYWKVRIWDQNNQPTGWSDMAWFETSFLDEKAWESKWIANSRPLPIKDEDFYKDIPNPLLRKEFTTAKKIQTGRLYISGLGYYTAYINGKRVGDCILDPAWTNYSKEVMYSTYDITDLLLTGKNAIGVMLGNGWYNLIPFKMFTQFQFRNVLTSGKPCLKACLRITYSDGSSDEIQTNDTWKTGDGPIIMNSVYLGETYDARLEQEGWTKAGFNDLSWTKAEEIDGPKGHLTAQYQPPIRATKTLKPISVKQTAKGTYLFDFGQNFAGEPRLKVSGSAGTKIVMQTGEALHADGSLNYLTVVAGQLKAMWNLRGGPGCPDDPRNIITYILKGNGTETYTPEYTFSSFRYVEVSGYPGVPDLNSIEGVRMNSDLQETGSFSCSNDMFNKINDVAKWTFLSNVFSVQSDCPGREKLGYGADIVATAEAYSYTFDMSGFYKKTVTDYVNDVRPNGGMPEIAPNVGIASESMGEGTGSPGWQLAFPFGMKVLYDYYADKSTLESYYDVLKKQVDLMNRITPSHIVKRDIGDHESIDPKPVSLSGTAFYYHHVLILIEAAKVLKRTDDVKTYTTLARDIRTAFQNEFLKNETGVFDSGTQTAQLTAMFYNLVPDDEKDKAFARLLLEIYKKHNGHLSTGIYGTKYLFDVLRTENRNDVAYDVANQRTFPGWGNMLANGATTLYESWKRPDTVGSQNHPMFGSIVEWYYKSLLGINATAPGFTSFEIKPQPAGDLIWAKGYYDAITGKIVSDWKIEGTRFYFNVTVPANTNATLFVPSIKGKAVLEGNKPATESVGLTFEKYENGYAVFKAESGTYSFTSVYDY